MRRPSRASPTTFLERARLCEVLRFAQDDSARYNMKFSVNWLREFVDLPNNVDEIAELLTRAGVETEGIEQRGAKIDKVIVAQITTSSPHPNADRLTVCEVDDGTGIKRQIVCGATNYKVGDKVPLALPGAVLVNGLQIRKSKLRGVESEGMLCSAKELSLGEDASGLLILSSDAKTGAPIADLFSTDTILDVEITPNRGDLLSHFGLAREIAALTANKLRAPTPLRTADARVGVKISALRDCPFYSARRIDNVKVGPSPDWLRAKIESVGVRSINNIVDISNFVMLELGQPTHAFDADKLRGSINVRLARDGEIFLALDGKDYSLTRENLVIADDERAVGIGGVMGGEETGVTESTRNILLESAYFLPASIRRTARNLNLLSDASYRFERGVDPGKILYATQWATDLIREIAQGNPAKEIAAAGELPANLPEVTLSYRKCDQVIGLAIEPKTVDEILERFGLSKSTRLRQATARQTSAKQLARQSHFGDAGTWEIPTYRRDLRRDVDLIEEVVRAYGVEKIPGTDRSRFTPASAADESHDLETALRDELVAGGLAEVRTSKLISRHSIAASENAIELRNPLSEDHVALRSSLLAGFLDVLDRNVRAGAERVAIFELGRVFIPPTGREERRLGILLWGNATSAPRWRAETKRCLDFLDLKGAIESLPNRSLSFRRVDRPDFALATEILSGDRIIGLAGQLSAARASAMDARGPIVFAELHLDFELEEQKPGKRFRDIEKFPAVTRDIAMIVPEQVTHAEILRTIEEPEEPLLESVQLFDLFEGQEVTGPGPAGKSLAYTLTYRDKNRTLTNEEVTVAHARIRERLQRELGVTLRE
jgi:phenylalanyl-tRNA synthetase beta chain